jgi:hypothetical protein
MPDLGSPNRPGQSSPPSSITSIASDQSKANPVIATTDPLEQGLIEEHIRQRRLKYEAPRPGWILGCAEGCCSSHRGRE